MKKSTKRKRELNEISQDIIEEISKALIEEICFNATNATNAATCDKLIDEFNEKFLEEEDARIVAAVINEISQVQQSEAKCGPEPVCVGVSGAPPKAD
jgi:chaperonin GroEL (HSP60 family)